MLQTLMPSWKTIKSLLQAYAQADGREVFHSPKPKLAVQAVQPYAADAAQWLRVNSNSGVLAGIARFGMMMPAGMVDFFGPMAEETPAQSMTRMSGEMMNGMVAVTTRLANLTLGPASDLPEFESRAAWTEWALSAAACVWGAKRIMGGTNATPQIALETLQPVFASANGVSAAAPIILELPSPKNFAPLMMASNDLDVDGNGKKPRNHVPDKDKLRALYDQFGGKVAKIAKVLGLTRAAIYGALERYGLKDLLPVRSRRSRPVANPDRTFPSHDVLAVKYVELGYNWKAVADYFGFSYATLHVRINSALQNGPSVLKAIVEVRRGLVSHISDSHIEAVLIAHNLDLKRAAGFLRMTPEEILQRAREARYGTGLHLMQGLTYK